MTDRDYVLGTQDEEIQRLGLQHRVWRSRVLDAWRRAHIGTGDTIIDVGAGPGFASLDLAEIVGPQGKIVALERSGRFLDQLSAEAARRGISNIEPLEHDVSEAGFGEGVADAIWCRWLLCFVADPRRTISHIAKAVKPGGRVVLHEYGDYGAWQMLPPNEDIDRFRTLVMQSWRDAGGEPDIGLKLPGWLQDEGLEILDIRPLVDTVGPKDFIWTWPAAFIASNAKRLHELGYVEAEEADRFAQALEKSGPNAFMITPVVLEIIARRP